jgi:transposase-like protein
MGKRMGRPPGDTYTPEVGARICERLAQVGSLRRVCREPGMPSDGTVRAWVAAHEDFAAAYARAKEAGIDALIEEGLDISDDGSNDWQEAEKGPMLNAEHVSRSKLRTEYRRWLAERMMPKKYGVKQDITSGGKELPAAAAPVFNVILAK